VNPDVSVVVPTLNRCDTLAHVLPTLARQTFAPDRFEILLCDTGSTDGTQALVAQLAIPNLTLVEIAHGERSVARNTGIRRARGAIVVFTDADILADTRLVEEHVRAHAMHPGAAIVGWESRVASLEEYRFVAVAPERRHRLHAARAGRLSWMFFLTGNASAARDVLLRAGAFDEAFTGYGHEDLDLGYRLRRLGVPIVYHPAAVNYHWHPESFPVRCGKMELAGRATVRFYRKHRDWRILLRMGVNPISLGVHALLPSNGRIVRACAARADHSAACREITLQHRYLTGVKAAWREAEGQGG
jgi:glycosyltransferase involved in cell wall biosynthesis